MFASDSQVMALIENGMQVSKEIRAAVVRRLRAANAS